MSSKSVVVTTEELMRFVRDIITKLGATNEDANTVAEVLMTADYRGIIKEGLRSLHLYVEDMDEGRWDVTASPIVLADNLATAWVDGCNGLGPVVASFCMNLAIQKAKKAGIGFVTCKGSNRFGAASCYTLTAARYGMIGLMFANSEPRMVPPRASNPRIGYNWLSAAGPCSKEDNFSFTMNFSSQSLSRVEEQHRKFSGEKEPLIVYPLGTDSQKDFSYKGFGFAIIVEVLCGVLAGASYGSQTTKVAEGLSPPDLAQCFVAIDPDCIAMGYDQRLTILLDFLRTMEPADKLHPVIVPGDIERQHMAQVTNFGGIHYYMSLIKSVNGLGKPLGVVPLHYHPI